MSHARLVDAKGERISTLALIVRGRFSVAMGLAELGRRRRRRSAARGVDRGNSYFYCPGGLVCTARLPLFSSTLNWLADLIRGHLKKIGSRWRALPAGEVATIVLAVLRCDQWPATWPVAAGYTAPP
ncbi:hypothetical protein ACFWIJ_06505 [Streptomyces sp. NPDC127079]|uniref:hypothetical protein n=1 Tax=Streptomyces sp. NPDC127079 TaxID=3347132 RepID=UPI00366510F8